MSYQVKEFEGLYDIVEKETGEVIFLGYVEKRARDICRKLNLGSGFNGWTPQFFSISYAIEEDEVEEEV